MNVLHGVLCEATRSLLPSDRRVTHKLKGHASTGTYCGLCVCMQITIANYPKEPGCKRCKMCLKNRMINNRRLVKRLR